MLDSTAKKLVRLLEDGSTVEARASAAVVLGELSVKDPEIGTVLSQSLEDEDATVRAQAMHAIGKLKVEAALPKLLDVVRAGGPEAEIAAHAAARLGPRGTHGLQELMHHVAPGLRRWIASALGGGGTASAGTAAVDALLDSDPGVVDAAARTLLSELSHLPEPSRKALSRHVLQLLGKKNSALSVASETALVRLLAALSEPAAEKHFWNRIGPGRPPEIRAASLQALGNLGAHTGKDALKRLLVCASDRDFRVAAPALMILKGWNASDRNLDDWLPLFSAPDVAVRRFAIEKLAGRDRPEVAEALLAQLDHPDRDLRKLALDTLTQLEHGRQTLAHALMDATTVDSAWNLSRVQMPFVKDYAPSLRNAIRSHAFGYLEAADRRADPLLALLKEHDFRALRDAMEERALAARKKKHFDTALIYLRWLTRDPACGEGIRFEAAACMLKISEHNVSADFRMQDPALQQFSRLLHQHETEPITRVRQAKWLDAEDLFYLGFHFVEQSGPEKKFGGEVLDLVIRRSPRSRMAKEAKSKMSSAGL